MQRSYQRMLDTDIASYIMDQRYPIVEARLRDHDPETLCLSIITCGEILFGLKRLPQLHPLHLKAHRFLNGFSILPWDIRAVAVYPEIRFMLESTGQKIGELDCLIAAHAMAIDATLVTNNTRHFSRIPGLRLENWTLTPE